MDRAEPLIWSTLHMQLAKGCGQLTAASCGPEIGSISITPPVPTCATSSVPTLELGGRVQSPGLTLSTWFTISFMRFCTVRRSLCFLNYGKDTEGFPGWL